MFVTTDSPPIPNGHNGAADPANRDHSGRFGTGNRAAAGRKPSKYSQHRTAVCDAVTNVLTPERMTSVLEALVSIVLDDKAKASDRINAGKLVLERGLGGVAADVESEDRIGAIERQLTGLLEAMHR